ncbi:MAG: hypothetical protein J6T94_11375 [Bacteroidaceae bacterium]|nr:hypothetical protein [Bacteroidaceae bacterium]
MPDREGNFASSYWKNEEDTRFLPSFPPFSDVPLGAIFIPGFFEKESRDMKKGKIFLEKGKKFIPSPKFFILLA